MQDRETGATALLANYKLSSQNARKLSLADEQDLCEQLSEYRPAQVMSQDACYGTAEFWTVEDVKTMIWQWYGRKFRDASSYRKLLHRCGFSYQKAEQLYKSRPSQVTGADFKLENPDGVVLAIDQMSVYLQWSLCRVWSPVGQTPFVRSSPQRNSLKFYGALNVESGTEIALTLPKMNGENTIHFLEHILTCIPDVPRLLLWDRATWHKGITREFVEAHLRLDMLYFPPACPDLNPQEHVWKLTRDHVGHLHDYAHLSDLRHAFQAFLDQTQFRFHGIEKFFPIPSYTSVFI